MSLQGQPAFSRAGTGRGALPVLPVSPGTGEAQRSNPCGNSDAEQRKGSDSEKETRKNAGDHRRLFCQTWGVPERHDLLLVSRYRDGVCFMWRKTTTGTCQACSRETPSELPQGVTPREGTPPQRQVAASRPSDLRFAGGGGQVRQRHGRCQGILLWD